MDRIRQKSREFTEESIYRLLLRFSLPATVGTAAFALYNVVDRVFIGRAMGPLALSGLTVTFPIFMVCIAIGMLVGIEGGTLISLRLGERRPEEAENILGNVVSLFVVGGVVMAAAGHVFLDRLLLFFGATPATLPYARDYMRLLLWFIPIDFLAMGTNNLLRAEGNPGISMHTMVVGALINIALDYVFIFPLGMGVRGAALATGISKSVSAVWILGHFRIGRHRALTLRLRNLSLRWDIVRPLVFIGLSPFIMQFVGSTVVVLLNRQLLRYSSELAVAAMGAVFSVMMLFNMPVMGLIQGGQPIIGFNYGARDFARVRQAMRASLLYAGLVGACGLALTQAFPALLIGMFGKESPEFLALGKRGLRLFLAAFPLISLGMTGTNFFQATGRPHLSIALNLFRSLAGLVPALLVLPLFMGLTGVWLAGPASDTVGFALIAAFLVREDRALKSAATGTPVTPIQYGPYNSPPDWPVR